MYKRFVEENPVDIWEDDLESIRAEQDEMYKEAELEDEKRRFLREYEIYVRKCFCI
jgi:hypothetical protein